MSITVSADLSFELGRPGRDPISGRVTGGGQRLDVEVSDPAAFAGSGDAGSVRFLAELLGAQGMVVRITHEAVPIVSLGAVRASWWQRRLTGSRCIRVASLRGVWTSARGRARSQPPALPAADLLPPLTMFPLVPTLRYRQRNQVTTTHDPARGGNPRLVLVTPDAGSSRARPPAYWLHDEMTIGSRPTCDIVLSDLEPVHARLRHDEDDEWLVQAVAGVTRVHGASITSQRLRTGTMVQMGGHQLIFTRDEFADHGRPYGGRIGGELGSNTAQPRRARPPR